jgi:DNA-binding HxlR family transcriptional regulator
MEMDLLKLPIREHARIYAALSDEKRIEILLRLYDSKMMSFKELKEALHIPQGTLNYHLKMLETVGLIENVLERRSGTISQYRLTEKGRELVTTMYTLMEKSVQK